MKSFVYKSLECKLELTSFYILNAWRSTEEKTLRENTNWFDEFAVKCCYHGQNGRCYAHLYVKHSYYLNTKRASEYFMKIWDSTICCYRQRRINQLIYRIFGNLVTLFVPNVSIYMMFFLWRQVMFMYYLFLLKPSFLSNERHEKIYSIL